MTREAYEKASEIIAQIEEAEQEFKTLFVRLDTVASFASVFRKNYLAAVIDLTLQAYNSEIERLEELLEKV